MNVRAAWPYSADLPQRYDVNLRRYQGRGGRVRIEQDVKGFLTGGDNEGDMARFYFFCLLLDQVLKEGLKGDVAELGVYKGSTASLLANLARQIGGTAYLFDTFRGFDSKDLQGVDADKRMEFADTSLEAVRSVVGAENTQFVQGYFPASASQIPVDARFCVVHIDCDLYAPMLSALDYFYTRMVPGGFMIMHDYSSLHWNGAERAVDEFFADKSECVIPMPDRAGSALVRKARPANRQDNWLMHHRRAILDQGWVGPGYALGLQELLDTGWSELEPWGVWGVGKSHIIKIFLSTDRRNDDVLEFDVQAPLLGERMSTSINVFASGQLITTWSFDQQMNGGVRELTLPPNLLGGDSMVEIEFRPQSIASPCQLDPTNLDERQLGLGLRRLRLKPYQG